MRGGPILASRALHEQAAKFKMLRPTDSIVYPPDSEVINPRHFYQTAVSHWLQRTPRPLSIRQVLYFGRHPTRQKLVASANHAAEELTIRFAHRINMMQRLPYRIMENPHFLTVYEKYIYSFDMIRKLGRIQTLNDNEKFCDTGNKLLTLHTRVAADIITGMLEHMHYGCDSSDTAIINKLVAILLTSRLSRRVLVKQHLELTKALEKGEKEGAVGVVNLHTHVVDTAKRAAMLAQRWLSLQYPDAVMPEVVFEGDLDAYFPYIQTHFEYIIGVILLNSLEACLRRNVSDPVVVSISTKTDNVLVRISDHGGGVQDQDALANMWSFAKPLSTLSMPIDAEMLAGHGFFNLVFPSEDLGTNATIPEDFGRTKMGLGLAIARLYAEYWNGAVDLQSIDGFGCDVLLRLSRFGTNRENLRFTL